MAGDLQVIQRDEKGLWLKGQSGNPKGTPVGRRRFAKAVERRLHNIECIEDMADEFVAGLKAPDAKPVIGRIAWERFWPTKHDPASEDAPEGAPPSSEDQWARVTARLGEEVPDDLRSDSERAAAGAIEGSD